MDTIPSKAEGTLQKKAERIGKPENKKEECKLPSFEQFTATATINSQQLRMTTLNLNRRDSNQACMEKELRNSYPSRLNYFLLKDTGMGRSLPSAV